MSGKSTFILSGILLSAAAIGCGPKQPAFDDLHPVTGKITYGGLAPGGGVVKFEPIPAKDEFIINGLLDAEGNFKLTTVRTTDSSGERKNGAPAGEYNVVFMPPNEDQTKQYVPPVTLPQTVKIEAKDNVLTLDAPKQ
jgi:hypothetical protein